jgi:hypothetical protein
MLAALATTIKETVKATRKTIIASNIFLTFHKDMDKYLYKYESFMNY